MLWGPPSMNYFVLLHNHNLVRLTVCTISTGQSWSVLLCAVRIGMNYTGVRL